jgi:hypothetical protein
VRQPKIQPKQLEPLTDAVLMRVFRDYKVLIPLGATEKIAKELAREWLSLRPPQCLTGYQH